MSLCQKKRALASDQKVDILVGDKPGTPRVKVLWLRTETTDQKSMFLKEIVLLTRSQKNRTHLRKNRMPTLRFYKQQFLTKVTIIFVSLEHLGGVCWGLGGVCG